MRAFLTILFLLTSPAHAACEGRNLLDAMPKEESDSLRARAAAVPFASGNFWAATREDQRVLLIGTYHLGDPRHEASMQALEPEIETATTILVEAGPDEEARLVAHLSKNPSLMILTDGSLAEMLAPQDWNILSNALKSRGIPPFMGAKLQPWYVSLVLATPPCGMDTTLARSGLDARIIEHAKAAEVPVHALEPFDTIFRIFKAIPLDEQIGLIRSTLALEDRTEDFATTLADAYFSGESRLIWELMREESYRLPGYSRDRIDADLARLEEAMMSSRNRGWIPVIEEAASKGPTIAAFGALHLSGDQGVAALLAARGWTLTPWPQP